MKRILLLLLILLMVVATRSYAEDEPHRVKGNIDFSYDYATTLQAAKENGKPIFAYFTFAT